jgi:galactose mutarotase-like enzyme
MKQYIENDYLKLECSSEGAEIKSLIFKASGREAIWQADPDYWARYAPVLFPMVGKAINNTIICEGKSFPLMQHGFARDRVFEIISISEGMLHYRLTSDYETHKFYPYDFELDINYQLNEKKVEITYQVTNTGDNLLYFSIGAHPGFALDIPPDTFDDYSLVFQNIESVPQYYLKHGYIAGELKFSLLHNTNVIQLTPHLFDNDALIFQGITSEYVSLNHRHLGEILRLNAKNFPYMGIWAKPGAPFVCIEPWYGIADFANNQVPFEQKAGIQHLKAKETFKCHYSIEIFQ